MHRTTSYPQVYSSQHSPSLQITCPIMYLQSLFTVLAATVQISMLSGAFAKVDSDCDSFEIQSSDAPLQSIVGKEADGSMDVSWPSLFSRVS